MFNPITTGNRVTVGAPLQWVKHVYLGGQSLEISTQVNLGELQKQNTWWLKCPGKSFCVSWLIVTHRIASHTCTPRMTSQNMLLFRYTNVITSNVITYLLQYEHNIPNTVPVYQKCTKDLNTQRCNKGRGAFNVYTHYTFTTNFTNQFWFELVLTVPMSKSPVSTLSPGVDISMAGDGCWMGSSTCNVYNLLASQGLYYPWTLTRTGNKYTFSALWNKETDSIWQNFCAIHEQKVLRDDLIPAFYHHVR